MSNAKVTKEREVRIHAYLFNTSLRLLEIGQKQEEGSSHQFMASLVFTAFTLEAYLNWLGEKLFPHWSYLERLKPKEKLAVISDQLKVSVDHGQRPWQTMKLLFDFRNDIAHGKPETVTTNTVESIDEHLDDKLGQLARTYWEKFCTRDNAERAREDVEQILKTLHAAAGVKGDLGPLSAGLQVHGATIVSGPPKV